MKFASEALRQIYQPSFQYKKAGVMLFDLRPSADRQLGLFEQPTHIERQSQLNQAMDRVNQKYGRGTVAIAAAGIQKGWRMKRARVSPAYTTRFEELPKVW